jgi:hypothetical protein
MKCSVCGGNADTLDKVLLNTDGDFACSQTCAAKYRRDRNAFFNAVGNDEAYANWMAEGGVDVKQHGPGAWRMPKENSDE